MKRPILFTVVLLSLSFLMAAPHHYLPVSYLQPDGTPISIFASGDEYHNWLHDADNYSIVRNSKSFFVYADKKNDKIVPTNFIVGRDAPIGLVPGINYSPEKIKERYDSRQKFEAKHPTSKAPHTGLLNNITIFIKFADDPDFETDFQHYEQIFNDDSANASSVKSFYHEVSYNQLTIDTSFYPLPDGNNVLCYTDIYPRLYYCPISDINPIGYNPDDYFEIAEREHQMLARAVAYVADQIPSDLVLDGDYDGEVDNVCFIIQGHPQGWADLLWGHKWSLFYYSVYLNGARVYNYTFQMEQEMVTRPVSVLVHEIFHSLGAPDLYRYNTSSVVPVGRWDMMAVTTEPPSMTLGWMRAKYGNWIPLPNPIINSGTYTLAPISSSSTNSCYRIASWVQGEHYILEYRKMGEVYDQHIPGNGLIIYRLNLSVQGNAQGPPDELYIYRPLASTNNHPGDLNAAFFNADFGRTAINESMVPSGFTSTNAPGGLNIYDISSAGETISFKVKISNIQLVSPKWGDALFAGNSSTIRWKTKNSGGNIKIEFSPDLGNSWEVLTESTPNTGSFVWNNIPNLDSEDCQIKVSIIGTYSSDTSTYPFGIYTFLSSPELIEPADGAADTPTNPLLSWQSIPGTTHYIVQLSAMPDFSSLTVNVSNNVGNTFQCAGLQPFSTYYWRVAGVAGSLVSQFSDSFSLTTGSLSENPDTPALVSPQNMATNIPMNARLTWNPSFLAETYRIQVASDSYFSNLVLEETGIAETYFTTEPLLANTSYFWRVSAQNGFGGSMYSSSRRFTTGNTINIEEDLIVPAQTVLLQNTPNPFNPSTRINYALAKRSDVQIEIYNLKGQKLRSFEFLNQREGIHYLLWDGLDQVGKPAATGIYFYIMRTGEYTATRKMIMIK